jgi:hypothetical protein
MDGYDKRFDAANRLLTLRISLWYIPNHTDMQEAMSFISLWVVMTFIKCKVTITVNKHVM